MDAAVAVTVGEVPSGGRLSTESPLAVRGTPDVHVTVRWKGLAPGRHRQQVVVYAPTGAVYQVLERSFRVWDGRWDGPAPGEEEGRRRMARGEEMVVRGASYDVPVAMAVAGTAIESLGLAGDWRFEVRLDEETWSRAVTVARLEVEP